MLSKWLISPTYTLGYIGIITQILTFSNETSYSDHCLAEGGWTPYGGFNLQVGRAKWVSWARNGLPKLKKKTEM